MSYPDSVSFDVRIHVEPYDLPGIVQIVRELGEGFPTILGVDILTPDALPYGNEEHDVWV